MVIFTAENLVKVFAISRIVQGTVMTQGPKRSLDMYGCLPKHNDAAAQLAASQFGNGIFSIGLWVYCIVLQEMTLETTNQLVYLFWIFQYTGKLMSGQASNVGFETSYKIAMSVFALATIAMSYEFSSTVLKILCGLWALSGVQMIWSPEASGKAWKATKPNNMENPAFRILIQQHGWFLVSYSVLNLALVLGVGNDDEAVAIAPTKAVGLCCCVWSAMFVWMLTSRKLAKLGVPTSPQIAWLLLHAAVSYACLG
eukprot:CAMPEP_0113445724 /NCGR_PEP_ID=MMETSP0014_2-20120614/3335_1 /TAXON_ID=2857 /ORGANISM="Nitzschia sp." /LENGTH=254 /DNA_ID=CAMNT_0000336787 /DNA_START=103 /DNA_END=867 /DNA_ORIENTATION=- /assembly_acc=CAM_ASM_000159